MQQWNESLESQEVNSEEEYAAVRKKSKKILIAGVSTFVIAGVVIGGLALSDSQGKEKAAQAQAQAERDSAEAARNAEEKAKSENVLPGISDDQKQSAGPADNSQDLVAPPGVQGGGERKYTTVKGKDVFGEYRKTNYTFSKQVSDYLNKKYGYAQDEKMWYMVGSPEESMYWFTDGEEERKVFKVERVGPNQFEDSYADYFLGYTQEWEDNYIPDYPEVMGFYIPTNEYTYGNEGGMPMESMGAFYQQMGFSYNIIVNDDLKASGEKYRDLIKKMVQDMTGGSLLPDDTNVQVYSMSENDYYAVMAEGPDKVTGRDFEDIANEKQSYGVRPNGFVTEANNR